MQARLRADGPLDVAHTLARFRLWGEDPANRLSDDGVFRRAVRVGARWHGYEVRWRGDPDDAEVTVSVPGVRRAAVLEAATDEVRRLCGLPLDLVGFYRFAARQGTLCGLARRLYGLRPTLAPQPLEMLVGAICAQQVNLAFAFALRARIVRRFGHPVEVAGHTVFGFPDAEALARARVADLRLLKLSGPKARYIVGLARLVTDGRLDLDALADLSNDGVIEVLTAVPGLGRWTAEWFLARGLGRGDVCPAGDLAVRKAFGHFFGRGRRLTDDAIRRRAAAWGPHQNLAVHYLLAGQRLVSARAGGGT